MSIFDANINLPKAPRATIDSGLRAGLLAWDTTNLLMLYSPDGTAKHEFLTKVATDSLLAGKQASNAFLTSVNQYLTTTSNVKFGSLKISDSVSVAGTGNTNWLLVGSHPMTDQGESYKYYITVYGGDYSDGGKIEFVFDSFGKNASSTSYGVRRLSSTWKNSENEIFNSLEFKVYRKDSDNTFEIYLRGLSVSYFQITVDVKVLKPTTGLFSQYVPFTATLPSTGYTLLSTGIDEQPTRTLSDRLFLRDITKPRSDSYNYLNGNMTTVSFDGTSIVSDSKITLPASTTLASSLKITAGVAPTSPGSGDIWNEGAYLLYRNNTGTRYLTQTAGLTTNAIPKALGSGLLGNSLLVDDGTNVTQQSGYFMNKNANASDIAFASIIGTNPNSSWVVNADGKIEWGSGSTIRDTNLYRSAANILKTDDNFEANQLLVSGNYVNGQAVFGGTGQAANVYFKRGSDGGLSARIGYSSATEAGEFQIASNGGGGTLNFQTGGTTRAKISTTGDFIIDAYTGNKALISNGSKALVESAVTSTELGYLAGVTSAIQTQISDKINGSGTVSYIPKLTGSKTLGNSIISDDGVTVTIGATGTITNPRILLTHNSGQAGGPELVLGHPAGGGNDESSNKLKFGSGNSGYRHIATTQPKYKFQRWNSTTLAFENVFSLEGTVSSSKDVTFFGSLILDPLTGNKALISNGSKAIAESSVTSTELGYLSGVTSSIQTQLNARLTANQNISLSGVVTGSGTTAITTAIADGALSIAKTSGLQAALDSKAALTSPTFTGTPLAPTASIGTNNTQIATTAFVQNKVAARTLPSSHLTANITTTNAKVCSIVIPANTISINAGFPSFVNFDFSGYNDSWGFAQTYQLRINSTIIGTITTTTTGNKGFYISGKVCCQNGSQALFYLAKTYVEDVGIGSIEALEILDPTVSNEISIWAVSPSGLSTAKAILTAIVG